MILHSIMLPLTFITHPKSHCGETLEPSDQVDLILQFHHVGFLPMVWCLIGRFRHTSCICIISHCCGGLISLYIKSLVPLLPFAFDLIGFLIGFHKPNK